MIQKVGLFSSNIRQFFVISIFCGDKGLVIRLNKGYDRPQRILALKTLFIQRIYIYCKIIQAGFDAAGQPVQIGTYLHKIQRCYFSARRSCPIFGHRQAPGGK